METASCPMAGPNVPDATLPLQPQQPFVKPTRQQHRAVQTAQVLRGKMRVHRLIDGPILAQDGQLLDIVAKLDSLAGH